MISLKSRLLYSTHDKTQIYARFARDVTPVEFLHPLLRYVLAGHLLAISATPSYCCINSSHTDRGCSAVRYVYDKLRISMKLDRFIVALLPSFSSRAHAFHFFPRTLVISCRSLKCLCFLKRYIIVIIMFFHGY